MKKIIVDAGPFIALFDKDDKYHKDIKNLISRLNYKYITTWPVITEVTHLLDFNTNVQIDFLKWINLGGVEIFNLEIIHLSRMIKLSEKYIDLPMDFADASLVIVAEELGLNEIIAIDSDYDVYRLINKKQFKNIFKNQ